MDVLNDLVGRVDQDIVVETTIDPVLQAAAEKALIDELAKNGDKAGVGQGAIVSMTPDGAVRALVGGRNYAESQFNRAVAAKRQPGSAFKPFVYLTALERGLTPDTVREDKPISIKGWKPENYSREYFGPVTLKQALAMSLNTVSVRLTLEFGPTAVIRTAHRLGIASKLEPNASIALGTSEVSLLELVSALCAVRQRRHRGRAACGRARAHRRRQAALQPRPRTSLGRVIEPRYVGDDERDDAGDAAHRHRPQGRRCRAGRPPARPAPRRISATPGSSATPAISSPASGSATTTIRRPRKTTGGGMPVEIWSRFMKPAHQGVAGRRTARTAARAAAPPACCRRSAGLRALRSAAGAAGRDSRTWRQRQQRAAEPHVRPKPAASTRTWLIDPAVRPALILCARPARRSAGRMLRVSTHSSSEQQPASANAMASGHAVLPRM